MSQNSRNSNQKPPFWKTLTGILTAVGTFLAAIATLIGVFFQIGLFSKGQDVARVLPEHTVPRLGITTSQDERLRQKTIVIGGKLFLESSILLEMMASVIRNDNPSLNILRRHGLGDTFDTFYKLKTGDIDLYAEYTGTLFAQLLDLDYRQVRNNKLHENPSTINDLLRTNSETNNILWLEPFGFSNSSALVMLKEKAKKFGIVQISDLAKADLPNRLRFASQYAFYTRSDGLTGIQREYGFLFKNIQVIYHVNKYRALLKGEMDVTDGYETDPELHKEKKRFIVLEDNKGFFPPYYAAPLVNKKMLEHFPNITRSLGRLRCQVSANDMSNLMGEAIKQGLNPVKLAVVASDQITLEEMVKICLTDNNVLKKVGNIPRQSHKICSVNKPEELPRFCR
jgi:glycine betaine/choline ABC-type transport system substrate-binding protein